ncbi:Phenylalanine aminomutase (L-beta-phenylalanine forming) [Paramyrothecium foliicola]|nr:Phenylalanine aminomutase (L-beta-phenylalanine forming) [Paramyrothecium foliicola]
MESSRHYPFFLQSTPLILLCLLLVTCNVSLYTQIRRLQLAVDDHGFTGIYSRGKSWKQFHTYTEYSNVNQSISDMAWSGFTTNGFVAIPHHEAARVGLPAAEDFPDDPEKGVYVLAGFHELHCVIYLREVIQDLMAGKSVDGKAIHINHCYDALRQEIQCRASDYPLYAPYQSKLTGDGQFRLCRDWDALTEFAKEHTACWPTGHCADLEGP